jgi:TATA-binding protein-associated factor
VFCQWKATVDLLADYFRQGTMGDVTFLRLDGSTPVNQRQTVVDRFNADPSIDLLLLTTHVCEH